MYILGVDPGQSCGIALYDTSEELLRVCADVPPEEVFDMLETLPAEDFYCVACEKPVRPPFGKPIDMVVFRVAYIVEYICTQRGLHLKWVQPSQHKTRFKGINKKDYPLLDSPHQLDAFTIALFAAKT